MECLCDEEPAQHYGSLEQDIYHENDEDCEPKDLSIKSTKKLKAIPPPLDLSVSSNLLKEFESTAPSPKSPLIQKNLPFRKRAHSCSNVEEPADVDRPLPSVKEEPVHEDNVCDAPAYAMPRTVETVPKANQLISYVSGGVYDLVPENSFSSSSNSIRSQFFNSSRQSPTGSYLSSVLLSPAPSAHSNSHEELRNISSPGFCTPVWHCFKSGTLVKFDTSRGSTRGAWVSVDELVHLNLFPSDVVGILNVESVEQQLNATSACTSVIYFTCLEEDSSTGTVHRMGELVTQCYASHVFYVKDKGWCMPCHDQQHSLQCQLLEPGDIVLPPSSRLSSYDICERFKRFSFPPDECAMTSPLPSPRHCASALLSPPVSPTKKPSSTSVDKPKRPMNAFMLFAKKYRLELIQMHPGKDNRGISILLGEAWRSLSPSEKETYVSEAKRMADEQKRLHPDCWKRKRSHSTS